VKTVLLSSIVALAGAMPCWAGFSAPIGCYNQAASGTSVSCTLATAPAAGTAVAVFAVSHGQTGFAVKDGNSNVYTITPHSPASTYDATAGSAWLAYYIAGPSANPTVTASWASGACTACSITVMSFPVVGGSAVFDTDGIGSGATGATSLPTVIPGGSSDLLIGACADSGGCGKVTGSWVAGPTGLGSFLEEAEYTLAGSAPETVGFAGAGGATWDSIGMAFKFNASSGFTGAALKGAAVSAFSPCDLNQDGVINSADVTVAINSILTPPATCTAVITGAGSCNAAVVQRVVAATLPGGTCHPTSLSWVASSSSGVVGYNIYRTVTSGSNYVKLNASPLATTAYVDATSQAGQTYYYVATSINSAGSESAYSTPPATASVPNP
jgi:hypothetical protein